MNDLRSGLVYGLGIRGTNSWATVKLFFMDSLLALDFELVVWLRLFVSILVLLAEVTKELEFDDGWPDEN